MLEANDFFGVAISLDGNRLAVGAIGDDGQGNTTAYAGAAYLFTFSDAAFSNPKLEAIIGKGYVGGKNYDVSRLGSDRFGVGISLDGTRLAVGAYEDDGAAETFLCCGLFHLRTLFFHHPNWKHIGAGYTGGRITI